MKIILLEFSPLRCIPIIRNGKRKIILVLYLGQSKGPFTQIRIESSLFKDYQENGLFRFNRKLLNPYFQILSIKLILSSALRLFRKETD